jgi:hypothetical protein
VSEQRDDNLDEKMAHVRDETRPIRAVDIITPQQRGDLINALVYVERSLARLDAGDSRGQATVARAREDLGRSAEALRRVLGADERATAVKTDDWGVSAAAR